MRKWFRAPSSAFHVSVMSQPAKILIVDDNPVVLFAVAHLLKSEGFTVLEATTGKEGLVQARAEVPDLVLLDVMLPDINGVELCRQIKAGADTSQLFVVLLSSIETSPDSQVTGLEAGADGYIARPIENRELIARVQAMLRIKRAESALRKAHDELEKRVAERTEELSRANAALKALSQRLVDVQEAERRFVARELHDEIGQMVTGLKLVLETSVGAWNSGPGVSSQAAMPEPLESPNSEVETNSALLIARSAFEEALSLINDLMERVRQLSISLRPQMLDDLGLLTALDWHFKRYFKQTGIRVQFKHTHSKRGMGITEHGAADSAFPVPNSEFPRLPARLETAIFRIVQEALTNAARHARVKELSVRLWANGEQAGLQVRDEGAGFDTSEALKRGTSTGLSGMKERAELLGGEFILESTAGGGTCLTVELPLSQAVEAGGGI
jgi:signal transduction histidine kinase